jgi:ISXO2-like transposase domain
MRRIPNVNRDTLTDFVLDNIARGSEVRTDGWRGYDDIGRCRFKHVVTNVSASGDPAHVVLPHVHLSFRFNRRSFSVLKLAQMPQAPDLIGLVLGDSDQQQRQPAEEHVRADPVFLAMVDGA